MENVENETIKENREAEAKIEEFIKGFGDVCVKNMGYDKKGKTYER